MEALTIKQAAELLNLSYYTVYAHKQDWGFFQMEDSRVWRVYKSDLDQKRKKQNNTIRPCDRVGDKEKTKCRSEKIKTVSGKLTLPHRVASEFDAGGKRLTRN